MDYDTITLTWTDNAGDELGYKIERRKEGDETFVQIAKTQADLETYTDNSLEALTTYEYRIRAFNEAADSSYVTLSGGVTTQEGHFSWCFIDTVLH